MEMAYHAVDPPIYIVVTGNKKKFESYVFDATQTVRVIPSAVNRNQFTLTFIELLMSLRSSKPKALLDRDDIM